jgi:MFS family permease
MADVAADRDQPIAAVSPGYRSFALGLLLVIYIFNFIDRQVINILAEPIKNDLGLKDWQLGMMSGFAFALFYTVLGLPIARLAERRSRPAIIAAALAAWSGFTALCGLAQNFVHLVLARVGVGVGEAGCTPPAHSLITDYVPAEKRASALAFYSMGTPIGGLIGTALGGIIADAYGWRTAFFVCGLPGLALAAIVIATLIEPRAKRVLADAKTRAAHGATFGATLATLATKSTFWLIAFAAAIKAFIGYGHAPFTASFFLRNHTDAIADMARDVSVFLTAGFANAGLDWTVELKSLGFLGLALALVSGVGGALGSLLGGWIADKFGAKDLRAYVSVPGVAAIATIPIYVFAITTEFALAGILLLALNGILGTLWYGPVYATAQTIVPAHMRATSSAILLFVINLIGLGAGPVAVGALSDTLAGPFGLGPAEGIRWALIVSAGAGVIAFALFWAARRRIRDEMVG